MNPAAAARRAALRQAPREVGRELRIGRWLVLAPHPDDETLGAGALIGALADAGRCAQVVYLTDGAGSHPHSPSWSPERLAAKRRGEARAALRRLAGQRAAAPIFFDWPDARPHPAQSAAFSRSVDRLVALLRKRGITKLATTWSHEPHCDHTAAAALAMAAVQRMRGRVRVYWYVVWGWDAPQLDQLARCRALALPNPGPQAVRRGSALAQHRSQLGSVITDSPKGFRLPKALAKAAADRQMLFAARRA